MTSNEASREALMCPSTAELGVFTYDMWLDDQHLSTSLTTIAVEPEGKSTHLTYTEQAVHFDGLDSVEGREEGTRGILDGLGSFLTKES